MADSPFSGAASTTVTNGVQMLYREHQSWLLGWLQRKLGCSFDAADVSQDTYLRLLVSGRMPRAEQSRAYLTQVAKNLVIDLHRRRALEAAYLDALAALPKAESPSPETQALIIESLAQIDAALDSLPPRVRETFLLSQFDGLKYREIAERLDISQAAVRKYMLKAAVACLAAIDAPPTQRVRG